MTLSVQITTYFQRMRDMAARRIGFLRVRQKRARGGITTSSVCLFFFAAAAVAIALAHALLRSFPVLVGELPCPERVLPVLPAPPDQRD